MVNCRGLIACLLVGLVMKTSSAPGEPSQPLAIGNAKFTSAFFDQIRSQEGNLFFSPMSIELLLALAHRGAQGKTATQIQQAAHLLYDQYPWMETLKSDENITLNLVDAIFADKGFTIKQDYIDFVKNRLKAEVAQVNFGEAEEAAKTINDFVAKNTGNKIKDVIDTSDLNGSKLVLLNAVYFKADWSEKFSTTQKGIFHLNEHQDKEVDFMQVRKYLNTNVNKELDARIVEIPYKGNSVSMIIVVPNTINGLANLETKIAGYDLLRLTKNLYENRILLTMPKFKLDQTIDLKSLLIKMGVQDLFDPSKANLTGLAEGPLFASKAIQKTYIEVNEEGSESAAASAITFGGYAASSIREHLVPVFVDRPFLFFLKHKPTGLHLFMGRIVSP